MGIDHRGFYIRVAEYLFDGHEVDAGHDHPGGRGVAKIMETHVFYAGPLAGCLETLLRVA